ncbi:MAG: HD domain-containing protein [Rhodobacteraceae bacterium]|nr:HD domain-containing protein [Paracoccaceae bacterium]
MTELIQAAEAFARERHQGQLRKGAAQEPYIIHIEEVAHLTRVWGGSEAAIAAAWLHDTVEDCPPTSLEELADRFGAQVAGLVAELTDDKNLGKQARKDLQIANAPKKSPEACLVKMADKSSNVGSLANSPPADWPLERRLKYIEWARDVVTALPEKPEIALAEFLDRCARAAQRAQADFPRST